MSRALQQVSLLGVLVLAIWRLDSPDLLAQIAPGKFASLVVTSTSTIALDVYGGGRFGTPANLLITTTGRIPALSTLYFDVISASNFTTGTVPTARLGSGAATSSTFLRGDQTWSNQAMTNYTATVADVANTAVETDAVSWTVPANEMANGHVLTMQVGALLKNNKGSAGTVTPRVYWGASSVSLTADTWGDSATEAKVMWSVVCQRIGNDLWVLDNNGAVGAQGIQLRIPWQASGAFNANPVANTVLVIAAPSFTTSQTVKLTVQLSAANANFYYKPQAAAVVWKIGS